MRARNCSRHGDSYPCTCGMGNLYRFVEPVVLLLLKQRGRSTGYDLTLELQGHALTDSAIEKGAIYRVLRKLEQNGNVKSEWKPSGAGPAKRIYRLTAAGEAHLEEWATVLENLSKSMKRFTREARAVGHGASPRARSA